MQQEKVPKDSCNYKGISVMLSKKQYTWLDEHSYCMAKFVRACIDEKMREQ